MNNEKRILKSLYKNDAVYEALYCAIVSDNDFIRELKQDIKDYRKDKDYNEELKQSIIKDRSEQLKEYQEKRRLLKKAFKQIYGDDLSEYND